MLVKTSIGPQSVDFCFGSLIVAGSINFVVVTLINVVDFRMDYLLDIIHHECGNKGSRKVLTIETHHF